MMSLSCFTMADLQTYDQIGITVAYIVTICHVAQGMAQEHKEIAGINNWPMSRPKRPVYTTKNCMTVGCIMTAATIWQKAAKAIPLPLCHDSRPMCLAFHVKGMCNTNCTQAHDHHPQTLANHQTLLTWCTQHWK